MYFIPPPPLVNLNSLGLHRIKQTFLAFQGTKIISPWPTRQLCL